MAASESKSMPEKQRRGLKIRPRTNLNGGDLVRSTFLVLIFTFTLAFMATLVLAFILAFLSLFGGSIFTLLWCNGEKRSIWSQSGSVPFEACGWTFARAHSGLRRRFAFHWFLLKAGIYCARRESRRRTESLWKRMDQTIWRCEATFNSATASICDFARLDGE